MSNQHESNTKLLFTNVSKQHDKNHDNIGYGPETEVSKDIINKSGAPNELFFSI